MTYLPYCTMDDNLKSRFLALYCMVLADGVIDIKELETLYRIGREHYNVSADEINQAIRESGTSFIMPENLESKIRLLYNLTEIALADGVLDVTEKNLLKRYAKRMNFLDENIDDIVDWMVEKVKGKEPIEQVFKEITE